MGRKKSISEDAILDAAEAVVAELGANRLSLNLVAEKAGISKGGLTYSFPTREALLSALTVRDFARYQKVLEASREGKSDHSSLMRAQLEAMRAASIDVDARAFSIMAAMTQVGAGMDAYREKYATYFRSIAKPDDPKSVVFMLATEALFMLRGSGVMQLPAQEWEQILNMIETVCIADDSKSTKGPTDV